MTTVSGNWGSLLSDSEREQWTALASNLKHTNALGQEYQPNGYNVFIQRNMNRLRIGMVFTKTPVRGNGAINDDDFSLAPLAGGVKIKVVLKADTGMALIAAAWEIWVAGPYTSPGRRAIEPEFKWETSCQACTSQNASGLTPERYYWIRARWVDKDGRTGVYRIGQAETLPL
ncbi:MAG: hypothetical protein JRC53_01180 [Deltaproteobacteria bacterium]|nr:hypothetical protein [Deltaproteobacteria bacterium]